MAMITADPKDVPQVESFAFTPENMEKVKGFIANYPPFSFWKPEYVGEVKAAMEHPPKPGTPLPRRALKRRANSR